MYPVLGVSLILGDKIGKYKTQDLVAASDTR